MRAYRIRSVLGRWLHTKDINKGLRTWAKVNERSWGTKIKVRDQTKGVVYSGFMRRVCTLNKVFQNHHPDLLTKPRRIRLFLTSNEY